MTCWQYWLRILGTQFALIGVALAAKGISFYLGH